MARLVVSAIVGVAAYVGSGFNPVVGFQAFAATCGESEPLFPSMETESHVNNECLDQAGPGDGSG